MANLLDIFGDIGFEARPVDSGKEPVIYSVPTVHADDKEAVCIIQPDLENGPWIAGGACLRWFQNQPVGESDIDVFCKNAVQAQQVIERIKSYGRFQVKFESENAVTLTYHKKDEWHNNWTIQVITRRYFSSLREVINNFDITVCEIGTTGTEWELGPFTARDVRERNLRFKLPLQPDSPKRLVKYWTYGYRPVEGTIEAIQANPDTRWTYSSDEEYSNAF
jgi:hypothetical protein